MGTPVFGDIRQTIISIILITAKNREIIKKGMTISFGPPLARIAVRKVKNKGPKNPHA
jgi:hypothetical protein